MKNSKCTIAGPQLDEFLSEGAFSKSLYRSGTGNHFYGTEYEIWANFGPIGNIEKKWGLL